MSDKILTFTKEEELKSEDCIEIEQIEKVINYPIKNIRTYFIFIACCLGSLTSYLTVKFMWSILFHLRKNHLSHYFSKLISSVGWFITFLVHTIGPMGQSSYKDERFDKSFILGNIFIAIGLSGITCSKKLWQIIFISSVLL